MSKYTDNLKKLFSEIIGQCITGMEQSLEGLSTYASIDDTSDSIALMKILERTCYSYQSHEYPPLEAWESIDRLSSLKQLELVSESEYHEKFKNNDRGIQS